MPKQLDHSTLEMALVGYAEQCRQIENAIAAIRGQLGVQSTKAASTTTDGAKPKRRLSAAARKRIAAAQKKPWAAFHNAQKQGPKKVAMKKAAPKRNLSPEPLIKAYPADK
jgi:hypothetical protein